ncbi:NAD kinase [Kineosporia rhizophila]|uniref:NAD kinase n=1 Tax=Kineosporia TaxID=49184 RepID=UPI001E62A9B7|nr:MULTISPECIES: NAD kinase [Kineosporia]MCE0539391.1 NAD kinase [Kineosporia rhizophila]GLY19859.1 NAD kinase 2 [Kineosporia sp. NBRC 101677]
MSTPDRRVLVLAHTGREAAVAAAEELVHLLVAAGIKPIVMPSDSEGLTDKTMELLHPAGSADPLEAIELVIVLGGDGTILRSAELVRGHTAPLLGVNLGHVGFLAESERDDLAYTVQRVAARDYEVEERMTLDVAVDLDGVRIADMWALNEASVEKANRERMIEVVIEVDGRPVTEFGCDGVVMATPTGSTAYAFSAGGPIVWPEVEALLLAPLSAHALFARPMVVAPTSVPAVELVQDTPGRAMLWCDGRRSMELPPGARVEVRRSAVPVRLARLARPPFTDRLVAKFGLPVHGWRGRATRGSHGPVGGWGAVAHSDSSGAQAKGPEYPSNTVSNGGSGKNPGTSGPPTSPTVEELP